jgi:hypothetical protein
MSESDDSDRMASDASLRPSAAANDSGPTAPGSQEIAALKHKVMTAVRSAITESLLVRDGTTLPPIDLDFSMPEQAEPKVPVTYAEKPRLDQIGSLAVGSGKNSPAVYKRPEASLSSIEHDRRTLSLHPPIQRSRLSTIALIAVPVLALALGLLVFALPHITAEPPASAHGSSTAPAPAKSITPIVPVAKPEQKKPQPTMAVAFPAQQPAEPARPVAAAPQAEAGLREAQTLLSQGQVVEARKRLLALVEQPAHGNSADIAFILARSYDGNYLGGIKAADANANHAEAERWYRRWFSLSVKAGSVSDGVVLDRLLRTLH